MIVTVFTAAALWNSDRNRLSRHIDSSVSQIKKRNQIKYIWIGQYIGTVIIILMSSGVIGRC